MEAQSTGILWDVRNWSIFSSIYVAQMRNISFRVLKKNGQRIVSGDKLVQLDGDIRDVAVVERTLLNFLQRMCGVATWTAQHVRTVGKKQFLACTRKTPFGMLDKKACFVGGGLTHRVYLSGKMEF